MTDLYGLLIASQGYVGQETPGKVSAPPPLPLDTFALYVVTYHVGSVHDGSN